MKRYIKSDIDNDKIYQLALDIDKYDSDTDPYEYRDCYDELEADPRAIDEVYQALLSGNTRIIIENLELDIDEHIDETDESSIETVQEAKSLIKRIKELQYK